MTVEITIKDDRRIYRIDIGDMPSEKVVEYIERIKEEINQKRIERD